MYARCQLVDFVDAITNAVAKGGWTGYVVIAIALIGAFLRGTIRPEREVTSMIEEKDKRFEEMRVDRDYWKATAQSTLKSLEQLTEVMESAQNRASSRP